MLIQAFIIITPSGPHTPLWAVKHSLIQHNYCNPFTKPYPKIGTLSSMVTLLTVQSYITNEFIDAFISIGVIETPFIHFSIVLISYNNKFVNIY